MDYIRYHRKRDRSRLGGDWAELIARFAKKYAPDAQKVLDLGCGRGFLVHEFKDNGIHTYGIDLRNIFEFERPSMSFADAKSLPFRDKTFDVITEAYTLSDMLELQKYNHDKINAVAKEALRVLKPGGCFITHPGNSVNLSFFGFKDVTEKDNYFFKKGIIAVYRRPT